MDERIFDTTLLIDLLRDNAKAEAYLERLPDETGLLTHAMVMAEVLEGISDSRELGRLDRTFRRFDLLHASEADSRVALRFLRHLHLSHRIGFPDCLIAATAIRLGVPVVTTNDRHFRLFTGLKVIRPY